MTNADFSGKMTIEVIGPGCSYCKRLYSLVQEVADEQGIDADIVHVTNLKTVLRNVPFTPVLKVNGNIVHRGKRLPEKDKLRSLICSTQEQIVKQK